MVASAPLAPVPQGRQALATVASAQLAPVPKDRQAMVASAPLAPVPQGRQATVESAPFAHVPQESQAMVAWVLPVVREVPDALPTEAGFAADCAIAPDLDVCTSATPWRRAARALLAKAVRTARINNGKKKNSSAAISCSGSSAATARSSDEELVEDREARGVGATPSKFLRNAGNGFLYHGFRRRT